ncbi:TPA: acyltransferase [Burkholderia vietnamiensis]|nr:acyltransferase [Burkholderia vietnamiensis]
MKQELPALTSLRFFAAAAIVALHAAQVPGFPSSNFGGFTLNHGVSFFYVLSGFILQYSYRDREIQWSQFFTLRVARIWPLHVCALALALALRWSDLTSWIHANMSAWSLASVVFLLQAWSPSSATYFGINGVAWSLSVEMFFYACFPLLTVAFRRRPWLALVAMLAVRVAYIYGTWSVEALHEYSGGLYTINPMSRILEFAIGIFATEMWMRARERSVRAPATLEIGALAAVALADLATMPIVNQLWGFIPPVRTTAYVMAPDVAIAVMLCVFASGRGMVSRALAYRPLMWLGQISFAIYLVHQPIQWAVSSLLQAIGPWGMLLVSVAMSIAVGAAAHRFIEKPAYRAVSRRLADRQVHDRAAAVQGNG